MALYLVGDVQGCNGALQSLLDTLAFSPTRDEIWFLGDMINRGADSLGALQTIESLGNSAHCLLGNHDLHYLALAAGVRKPSRHDTLDALLVPAQSEHWTAWLRQQKLAARVNGWLLLHAGLPPQWDADAALREAAQIESGLRAADWHEFLRTLFGNTPDLWSETLQGAERTRFATNALTRIRLVDAQGRLDFSYKGESAEIPAGHYPWFEAPQRLSAGQRIAFGHWSALGLVTRRDLLALDTGCVWGRTLSAARLDSSNGEVMEILQVPCPQSDRVRA